MYLLSTTVYFFISFSQSFLTHPFLLFLYTLAILSVGTPYFSDICRWQIKAVCKQVNKKTLHITFNRKASLTASIRPLSVGDLSIKASKTSSISFLTYNSTAERRRRKESQVLLLTSFHTCVSPVEHWVNIRLLSDVYGCHIYYINHSINQSLSI